MLNSLVPAISHPELHNPRPEHRCQSLGQNGRRDIPPTPPERLCLLFHHQGHRRGLRNHRQSDSVQEERGRGRGGQDPGPLLSGHLALAHGRRGLFDEAQGDDVVDRAETDRPRPAADLAKCWVFAAVEGDGGRVVRELLAGGGRIAEAGKAPVGFV